jgi:hypothetical protein
MNNLDIIQERKRQDVCEGCGKSILDPEKECQNCGFFPHKAYHERSAAQTLGISKWLQNSPVMQPNQKITENKQKTMNNLINYSTFVDKDIDLDRVLEAALQDTSEEDLNEEFETESGLCFFEEACIEEGLELSNENEDLNEGFLKNLISKVGQIAKGKLGDILKGIGLKAAGPAGPVLDMAIKGITSIFSKHKKAATDKKILRAEAAKDPQIQKVGDIYAKTLEKLLQQAKTNKAAFMTPEALASLKNLLVTSQAVNQATGSIVKQAKEGGAGSSQLTV